MPVTKTAVRSVLSRAISSVIYTPGGVAVTRNIIKLNKSLSQYFTFASQEALGDFEYQFDFFSTDFDGSTFVAMIGNDSSSISDVRGTVYGKESKISIRTDTQNIASPANNPTISKNTFHTVNVKQVGSALTIKVDGATVLTPGSTVNPLLNRIGLGWVFVGSGFKFDGYIKDVHLISGFPQNKLFKLDEPLVDSSAIIDSNGGSAGVMINGGAAYSEPFTLNTKTTPHVWSNHDNSIQLPVFGTISTAQEGENGYYRNMIKMNKSLNQYFTFANQLDSGDFEIQLDYFSNYSASSGILGLLGPNTSGSVADIEGEFYFAYHGGLYGDGEFLAAGVANFGEFNVLNIKVENSVLTVKINNVTVVNKTYLSTQVQYGVIGAIHDSTGNTFDGYIKDVHLISGFPQNKLFKLDEPLVGSSAIIDSNGGSAGVMINGGAAYSEPFVLNTTVSPNLWVKYTDSSTTLPIAGT